MQVYYNGLTFEEYDCVNTSTVPFSKRGGVHLHLLKFSLCPVANNELHFAVAGHMPICEQTGIYTFDCAGDHACESEYVLYISLWRHMASLYFVH